MRIYKRVNVILWWNIFPLKFYRLIKKAQIQLTSWSFRSDKEISFTILILYQIRKETVKSTV